MCPPETYIIEYRDGSRYGPVGSGTLAAWANIGRIDGSTPIECLSSGQIIPFSALSTNAETNANPASVTKTPKRFEYPQVGCYASMAPLEARVAEALQRSWTCFGMAFILVAMSFFCYGLSAILGTVAASTGIAHSLAADRIIPSSGFQARIANIWVIVITLSFTLTIFGFLSMMVLS